MQSKQQINKDAIVVSLAAFPVVLLVVLAFLPLPSFFRWHEGDLWLYYDTSLKLLQGKLPYRDFSLEYPPIALLPFVLPHLFVLGQPLSFIAYVRLFLIENALFSGLVALLLVKALSGWQRWRNSVLVLLIYILFVTIGLPLLPWRYDLFPALLTLLALLSVTTARPIPAGVWLSLSTVAKLYPVVLLPIFVAYYLAGKKYRALLRFSLSSVSATVILLLPFILTEPGKLLSFLHYHQLRGLQIESFLAGVILFVRIFGLTTAELVHNYGALHLESPLSVTTLEWLPLLFLLVFGVVLVNCWSRFKEEQVRNGTIASESLVAYVVVALLAFIATNKVFSPQYAVWLLPFAPLLRLRQVVLLLVIWTITIAIFPFTYEDLLALRPVAVLLLNLRNSLVFVLLLWLLGKYLPTSVRVALARSRRQFSPSNLVVPWFWLGIAAIFLFSMALRFWELNRFNTLVFDEVYYAKYGNYYLHHIPFLDSHPPLGKYLIALSIWIDKHNPFSYNLLKNSLTGSLLSPFSYRWLNAFIGSFIPLIVASIAYQLSRRRSYALIAGLFTAVDGLLLVESRYALINIYLVFFGLLGQLFFLLALDNQHRRYKFWLALSGICFGASIAVKWNGLGFLLSSYLVWLCLTLVQRVQSWQTANTNLSLTEGLSTSSLHNRASDRISILNLRRLSFVHLLLYLGAVPALVYCWAWIPHLQVYPVTGFWQLHQQMLAYHQQVGSGSQEHPYCSAWYSWLWMIRPVGYFFEKATSTLEPVSFSNAPLPANSIKEIYYDVHGMGNPVLWWLSAGAIFLVLWMLAQRTSIWVTSPRTTRNYSALLPQAIEFWIPLFLVLNYAANWLPWVTVTRCSFLYYYMSASVFAFLALAWIVERSLLGQQLWLRAVGVTTIFLILLAFAFWLPLYLGLPLSPEEFQSRMWLRSWI